MLLNIHFPFYQNIHVYTNIQNLARKSLLELVSKKSAERTLGNNSYVLNRLSISEGNSEFEIDDCVDDAGLTHLFETMTLLETVVRVNCTYGLPPPNRISIAE